MVVIRKAELEEVNKILDIKEDVFGEVEMGSYEKCFGIIEKHGHWFRTAKIDGILVGFINGIPVQSDADTLELTEMCVSKKHQNEGIGELLIKSFIFIAQQQGIQKIELKSGEAHAAFFEKYGFEYNEQGGMELITTKIRCSCSCGENN